LLPNERPLPARNRQAHAGDTTRFSGARIRRPAPFVKEDSPSMIDTQARRDRDRSRAFPAAGPAGLDLGARGATFPLMTTSESVRENP